MTIDYDRVALVFDEERPGGEYGSIWPGTVVTAGIAEIRGVCDEARYQVWGEDDRLFAEWREEQGFVDPPAGTYIEEQELAEDVWWDERYATQDERVRVAARGALVEHLWVTEVACGCSKGRSGHLHWMHRTDAGDVACTKGYGAVLGWRAWTVDELVDAVLAGEFEREPEPLAAASG